MALTVERVSETEVRLSWPDGTTGWTLQRASDISGGFEDAALEVMIEHDENAAYDVILDSRQFYRLVR